MNSTLSLTMLQAVLALAVAIAVGALGFVLIAWVKRWRLVQSLEGVQKRSIDPQTTASDAPTGKPRE